MDGARQQGGNAPNCSMDVHLQVLFELLKHRQINYAVYAVSRIEIIASLIGPQRTTDRLIPELEYIKSRAQDPQLQHELHKTIKALQQDKSLPY